MVWQHQASGVGSVKGFAKLAAVCKNTTVESHYFFNNIRKGLAHPKAESVTWFTVIGRFKIKNRLHKKLTKMGT